MYFYEDTRMKWLIYRPSQLTERAWHGPPYHNLPLMMIVPCILCNQQSILLSPSQISHTLWKHAQMGLSLHTNYCATQKNWHCWKQYVKVSWRVAQTYPRTSSSSISTPAQPQQRATWSNPTMGSKAPGQNKNRLWRAIWVLHRCRHLKWLRTQILAIYLDAQYLLS